MYKHPNRFFLNSYNERLDEKIKRQIGMTVGKTRETSTTIGMSENNQQIRKKKQIGRLLSAITAFHLRCL